MLKAVLPEFIGLVGGIVIGMVIIYNLGLV